MDENAPPIFEIEVNPILAKVDLSDDQRELVFIFGYVGEVTADTVRIYQGLDLGHYLEIDRDEIVYAEPVDKHQEASITKFVVFASTEVTLVKRVKATVTAGRISEAISRANRRRQTANIGRTSVPGSAEDFETNSPSVPGGTGPCPPPCQLPDGTCICLPMRPDFDF